LGKVTADLRFVVVEKPEELKKQIGKIIKTLDAVISQLTKERDFYKQTEISADGEVLKGLSDSILSDAERIKSSLL
jgi:hypothetical protein